jgi:hypothetical protein
MAKKTNKEEESNPDTANNKPTHDEFLITGIGASAGFHFDIDKEKHNA